MIATLTGEVAEKLTQLVILQVGGVGYGVLVSTIDYEHLHSGEKAKLYIYENIKEDAHNLIGFRQFETKRLFEQLLSVKNVGPKVALTILDIGSADRVRSAIADGDVKALQTAKGVGKRAAEQVVVELRDKMGVLVGEGAEHVVGRSGISAQDEAMQALVALGYSDSDAQAALESIEKDLPTEERIKLALKGNF